MDRIIALYSDYELARQVAIQLVADGFATDRVDVTALQDLGRAAGMPAAGVDGKLDKYFTSLLSDLEDEPIAARLAAAIRAGAASVTVHPRGEVEILRARELLQQHAPAEVFARLAPADTQGGLLGERAAGTRPGH
jgi:hypothetical protein